MRFAYCSYLADGFCVTPDIVTVVGYSLNSHGLCFVVDTVATFAFLLLCWLRGSDSRLDRLRHSALGVFGHGFGHLGLYMQWFGTSSGPRVMAMRPMLFLFGFWFSFMHALTSNRLFNAALAAAYTFIHFAYVPQQLAFTYAQCVVGRSVYMCKSVLPM